MAIKLPDGQPLRRADISYDLLTEIMDDPRAVFTSPHDLQGPKVTFKALYLEGILKSPKSSKVLTQKLLENPEFGEDFCKLSLLCNVGKINTTMACEQLRPLPPQTRQFTLATQVFYEMRTQLRTYHPVASLSRTVRQHTPHIKYTLTCARRMATCKVTRSSVP